jgi:hypothetical protein
LGKPLRYVSIALGAALIILGWFIISSEPAQREAAASVGELVAARFVDDPGALRPQAYGPAPPAATSLSWRTIMHRAITTRYAAGIACMILGAALIGIGVPSRSGGERAESMPPAPGARPGLLMLGAAGLLLLFGLVLAIADGFDGIGGYFGIRSALLLAGCGTTTFLFHRLRLVSVAAYYLGLASAGLVGLNLTRLALRASLSGFIFEITTFILLASAAGMVIVFLLIWRAIPGGLDRARLMDQFRRIAAGAGAATIIAGICMLRSAMLPQQAAAELANPAGSSGLDDPVVGSRVKENNAVPRDASGKRDTDSRVTAKHAHPDPIENRQAADSETKPDAGAPSTENVNDTDPEPAASDHHGAKSNPAPATPLTLADVLLSLSPAELEDLLHRVGIDVDANDDRVRRKIDHYASRLPIDDPEALLMLGDLMRAAEHEDIATRPAEDMASEATATPPAKEESESSTITRPAARTGGKPLEKLHRSGRPPIRSGLPPAGPIPKNETTRIGPSSVNSRVEPERIVNSPGSAPPSRSAPTQVALPDAAPLSPPPESPATVEIRRKLERAGQQEWDWLFAPQTSLGLPVREVPDTAESTGSAVENAQVPDTRVTSGNARTSTTTALRPAADEGTDDESTSPAPERPALPALTPAPAPAEAAMETRVSEAPGPAAPPPPDVASIVELTGLDAFIGRTTLAADRLGLLAIVIGSAVLLAALVLRGFRLRAPEEAGTDF